MPKVPINSTCCCGEAVRVGLDQQAAEPRLRLERGDRVGPRRHEHVEVALLDDDVLDALPSHRLDHGAEFVEGQRRRRVLAAEFVFDVDAALLEALDRARAFVGREGET